MHAMLPDQITPLLPALRRRATKLTRTPDEAEELAQEVVLRLWQVLKSQRSITKPDRYAMIMLHNLARQRWRNRHPTEELSDEMAQTQPEAPARLACASLQAAIAQLPRDQCRLMGMVAAGETSPRQLANITGLP